MAMVPIVSQTQGENNGGSDLSEVTEGDGLNLPGTRLNFPTRLPISWSIPQPFHNQVRDGVGVVPIEHRAPKNQRSVAPEIERSKSLDL